MKDGTVRQWEDHGRPGGSYTLSLRAVGDFAVVKDAWDKETWIPSADIQDIETTQRHGW